MRAALLPIILLAALAGCSSQPDPPGAVSADEDRQLDAAAGMLDANSVGPAANDAAEAP